MHLDTRCVYLLLILSLLFAMGCSKSSTNPTPPPENHAPAVTLNTTPPDTILNDQSATFTWSGSDPDGNLAYYMAGLNGTFDSLTVTTITYTSLSPLTAYTFKIFAVDSTGLHSDTLTHNFYVTTLQPQVTLTSVPPQNINVSISPTFAWHGVAPGSSITGYYAGLNGNLVWTTDTTVTYSPLPAQLNAKFQVVAENYQGLQSDTATYLFNVVTSQVLLTAYGQGVVDGDGDGFWTQFDVKWKPEVTIQTPMDVRLLVGVRTAYNPGSEVLDSTALVTRQFGQNDTLSYQLPLFTKNYYDLRAELHGTDGSVLASIPYNAITSLTHVGLEDIDGFTIWFASVDTSNGVDTLPPIGYYESIQIWVDVDEYGDDANIRLVLYERTSEEQLLGHEHVTPTDLFGIIHGSGPQDKMGWQITAMSAPDLYDYRIELRDHYTNQLLAQVPYGNPELTDIPLGIAVTGHRQNLVERIMAR